ncbi:MAG: YidC/Oxa1 family membrane protein insertase [Dehalococcoidales bacterium]|nr:YidC/Oxa1 family membrane protein insertase [Dehalococcoidales bacterium]
MNVWDLIVMQPMINVLIIMTHYLASNFGLAIIALTVIINLALMPLSLKQMHSQQAMQEMQPKLLELQKKYGKDKQAMAQEQMRLYKEAGMSPAGCMLPMIVQMPIWVALYQAVMLALAVAPEGLLNLSRYLYSWDIVYAILPLGRNFLWLDMAVPDMTMALLVGATMWLQQKMSTPTPMDPRAAAQSQMMMWMMPLMFAFLALSFPSGLSLYWVASSVVRIAMQYKVSGWGALKPAPKTTETKKYLKLSTGNEKPAAEDGKADITVDASGKPQEGTPGAAKPGKFMKYLPWRDRRQK